MACPSVAVRRDHAAARAKKRSAFRCGAAHGLTSREAWRTDRLAFDRCSVYVLSHRNAARWERDMFGKLDRESALVLAVGWLVALIATLT